MTFTYKLDQDIPKMCLPAENKRLLKVGHPQTYRQTERQTDGRTDRCDWKQ